MRELNLGVDGTAGTPSIIGIDKYHATVVDNTNGNYTIIFNSPYELVPQLKGFSMLASDRTLYVDAIDFDRITVQCTDLAGNAADADFYLSIIGSDHRILH